MPNWPRSYGSDDLDALRIDKWLWHARFCKTRGRAQEAASEGLIRVNGRRVERSSAAVHPGDIVTLPAGGKVLTVQVLALGERRGPAAEARLLYRALHDA